MQRKKRETKRRNLKIWMGEVKSERSNAKKTTNREEKNKGSKKKECNKNKDKKERNVKRARFKGMITKNDKNKKGKESESEDKNQK